MATSIHMAGQQFGKLIAVSMAGIHPTRKGRMWLCQCECGNEPIVEGRLLRDGTTKSCGCLPTGKIKHGHSFSLTYSSWRSMIRRCLTDNHVAYHRYGGRGITICERWLGNHGFENFLADMGERPSKGHGIDRFPDNNGNYEPVNCRWATMKEQQRNRRDNVIITFDGITQNISAWAEQVGIDRKTLERRIRKGWTVELALTTKPQKGITYASRLR